MVYGYIGYEPKWREEKKLIEAAEKLQRARKSKLIEANTALQKTQNSDSRTQKTHTPACNNNRISGVEKSTSWFSDFRPKSSSFDLHNVGGSALKMKLLTKLFRSKSDGSMKKKLSLSAESSPRGSPPTQPRRRFVRVLRNETNLGEEHTNPHVVRKYEKDFWEKTQSCLRKARSLDECSTTLSYQVIDHSILKKHGSMEHGAGSVDSDDATEGNADTGSPTTATKHASFKDDVEVLEFDIKEKCLHIHSYRESQVLHEPLHDDDDDFACMCHIDMSEDSVEYTSLESISEVGGDSSSSASSTELDAPVFEPVPLDVEEKKATDREATETDNSATLPSNATIPEPANTDAASSLLGAEKTLTQSDNDSPSISSIEQCCTDIEQLNTDLIEETNTETLPKKKKVPTATLR